MNATLQGMSIYDNSPDLAKLVRPGGGAVLTDKGRPVVLMLDISDDDPEAIIKAVRRPRASAAFESMREIAAMNGYMSDDEITAEIASARQERQGRQNLECRD